jgi:hypothetical protein
METDRLQSKKPFECLQSYLASHFAGNHADHKRITFPMELRSVAVTCQAAISEDDRTLRFRVQYPVRPPAGKRASTAVLVSCANNHIRYGALHFDWDTKETFYEAVHFIGAPEELDDDTIFYVTWCGLSIADRFYSALMHHWHTDALPHEAALFAELDGPEDRLEDGLKYDRKNWTNIMQKP